LIIIYNKFDISITRKKLNYRYNFIDETLSIDKISLLTIY